MALIALVLAITCAFASYEKLPLPTFKFDYIANEKEAKNCKDDENMIEVSMFKFRGEGFVTLKAKVGCTHKAAFIEILKACGGLDGNKGERCTHHLWLGAQESLEAIIASREEINMANSRLKGRSPPSEEINKLDSFLKSRVLEVDITTTYLSKLSKFFDNSAWPTECDRMTEPGGINEVNFKIESLGKIWTTMENVETRFSRSRERMCNVLFAIKNANEEEVKKKLFDWIEKKLSALNKVKQENVGVYIKYFHGSKIPIAEFLLRKEGNLKFLCWQDIEEFNLELKGDKKMRAADKDADKHKEL